MLSIPLAWEHPGLRFEPQELLCPLSRFSPGRLTSFTAKDRGSGSWKLVPGTEEEQDWDFRKTVGGWTQILSRREKNLKPECIWNAYGGEGNGSLGQWSCRLGVTQGGLPPQLSGFYSRASKPCISPSCLMSPKPHVLATFRILIFSPETKTLHIAASFVLKHTYACLSSVWQKIHESLLFLQGWIWLLTWCIKTPTVQKPPHLLPPSCHSLPATCTQMHRQLALRSQII